MSDEQAKSGRGAYEYQRLVDERHEAPPEDFQNPPGVSRGECDTDPDSHDESCDLEATAQIDDFALEETKPGTGIGGFEGEEDGGS